MLLQVPRGRRFLMSEVPLPGSRGSSRMTPPRRWLPRLRGLLPTSQVPPLPSALYYPPFRHFYFQPWVRADDRSLAVVAEAARVAVGGGDRIHPENARKSG